MYTVNFFFSDTVRTPSCYILHYIFFYSISHSPFRIISFISLVYVQNPTLPSQLYLQLHFLMQCFGWTDLRAFVTEYTLRSSLSLAGFLIDLHIHWADTSCVLNIYLFIYSVLADAKPDIIFRNLSNFLVF